MLLSLAGTDAAPPGRALSRIVGRGDDAAGGARPVGVLPHAGRAEALEGVRAEVVALRLRGETGGRAGREARAAEEAPGWLRRQWAARAGGSAAAARACSRLAGRRAVRYPSKNESAVENAGVGTPRSAACETTARHPAWQRPTSSTKYGARRRFESEGSESYASLIAPRKVERMMHLGSGV